MEAPLERWRAAGAILLHLGVAQMRAGDLSSARESLEASLRCTIADSREIFPHLAYACLSSHDAVSATEAVMEHLMAGGTPAQLAAVSADLLSIIPSPPSAWQSWSEVASSPAVYRDFSSRLGGSEVDLRDAQWEFGKRPIHSVAIRGDGYSLKRILAEGANPNSRWRNTTALHYATASDRLDLIDLLLYKGATAAGEGFAPVLVYSRSRRAVRRLVENGAELEARDDLGRTALIAATDVGRIEVAISLVEEGASVDATDNRGRTSLAIARSSNTPAHYKELIDLLESVGPVPG